MTKRLIQTSLNLLLGVGLIFSAANPAAAGERQTRAGAQGVPSYYSAPQSRGGEQGSSLSAYVTKSRDTSVPSYAASSRPQKDYVRFEETNKSQSEDSPAAGFYEPINYAYRVSGQTEGN